MRAVLIFRSIYIIKVLSKATELKDTFIERSFKGRTVVVLSVCDLRFILASAALAPKYK